MNYSELSHNALTHGIMVDYKNKVDERNAELLKQRVIAFNKHTGPRVGDYIKLPNGNYTRLTEQYRDSWQAGGGRGSYHLYGSGRCSYSGTLSDCIDKDVISTDPLAETRKGEVWFFSLDSAEAHNGVHFEIDFRVYKIKKGMEGKLAACYTK